LWFVVYARGEAACRKHLQAQTALLAALPARLAAVRVPHVGYG
jgi:hypothetical protein